MGWRGWNRAEKKGGQIVLALLAGLGWLLAAFTLQVQAQPQPGDVFREYTWTNEGGDAGGSLRVGGKSDYGGGPILLPHDLDLKEATRAEATLEKLLCHDGTRGLAVSINGNEWIPVPEAPGIAEPQWEYQHHAYPVVAIPLEHLKEGTGNQLRLKVSQEHPWNWPQHLIYGFHIRIHYDAARKPHPKGQLISPASGSALGLTANLEARPVVADKEADQEITRVDFLGDYEDLNLEGDGQYRRWHFHYIRGVLSNHLGTATSSPWKVAWDTSWVPDQPLPFRLAARITDSTGLSYFTEAVDGLTLFRDDLSVELCQPYDLPKKWVTRSGEKAEKFLVRGDLKDAIAARLVWVSWSPGYMEGLYLNGRKVFVREGPRYAYFLHRVPLEDLKALQPGENILKTGATPLYDGKMVHGMEVNWPGIMVLIQYRKNTK